jgi:hypothetical protein
VVVVNVDHPRWATGLTVLAMLLALFMYYAVLHRLVAGRSLNPPTGVLVALLPVPVFFVVRNTMIQVGILAFYGLSLLAAAVRGDRGCEVMSLPTLVLRQRSHLPCLLFSPLDWLEERIVRALRRAA